MPSSDTQFKVGNKIGPRFPKGNVPWNKGVPRKEEVKRRISETKKRKGQRPTILRGKDNPNWKGGISPFSARIRRSAIYQKWRTDIFERDDFVCQECGYNKGQILQAHHIKSFVEYPDLRFDEDNGITLCEKCHIKIHS